MPEYACYLCRRATARLLYRLEDRTVVRCRACGLIAIDPRPTFTELVKRFGPSVFAGSEDELAKPENRLKRQRFEYALTLLRQDYRKTGRLLDFGCGMGAFMRLAADAGFTVHGLDISEHPVAYVRERLGLPAIAGKLSQTGWPRGHFDVITLWDVLHQVPDPVATLRELREYLAPDGVMVIKVLNADGLVFKLVRAAYRLSFGVIRYPIEAAFRFTIFYFSPRTLQAGLEAAGLKTNRHYGESHKDFAALGRTRWGHRRWLRQLARLAYTAGRKLGMEEEIVAYAVSRADEQPPRKPR